jgi:lipopolysaccharide transport protein LptA
MKFLLLLPILTAFVLSSAFAQPAAPAEGDRVTEITSDKLLFDYAKKLAVFTGNVVVADPDIHITADKITIYLDKDDQVEKIVSEGRVVIKMEGLHSRSGRAEYTPGDGKVVLEDRPQVSRQGSILQAEEKMIYWRLENRLEANNVRMLNFQEDGRDRNLFP